MTDDGRMTADEREHAIQAYSKIAEQIKKEDELINQRLTWGASINGALLALLGVGGGLFKDFFQHSQIFVIIFCLIAILLSIIAMLVCWETIKGIKGARIQINYIRSVYYEKWKYKIENKVEEKGLNLPRPFLDKDTAAKVTAELGSWWGDNLFRLMIVLWVIVIGVCFLGAFLAIKCPFLIGTARPVGF